jgi:hypothetical protein
LNFTDGAFFVFFVATFALYYLASAASIQIAILAAASLVFYAWESPTLLAVFLASWLITGLTSCSGTCRDLANVEAAEANVSTRQPPEPTSDFSECHTEKSLSTTKTIGVADATEERGHTGVLASGRRSIHSMAAVPSLGDGHGVPAASAAGCVSAGTWARQSCRARAMPRCYQYQHIG